MQIECEDGQSHELPAYVISTGNSDSSFFAKVVIGEHLSILCTVSTSPALQASSSPLQLILHPPSLSSQHGKLHRALLSSLQLDSLEKTKLTVSLSVLLNNTSFEISHHLLNVATIGLLASGTPLSRCIFASSCFTSREGEIVSEQFALKAKLTEQAILAKGFGAGIGGGIVGFSVAGREGERDTTRLLSFLVAAANKVGKEIFAYFKLKEEA